MRLQRGYRAGLWEWTHDCPDCEHANDAHLICRDCNAPPHALCSGLVHSERDPLVYVPCHCNWIPGTPRKPQPAPVIEVTMAEFRSELENFDSIPPEEAARILALFSDFIQFLKEEDPSSPEPQIETAPEAGP